jgi:hypothetical protein
MDQDVPGSPLEDEDLVQLLPLPRRGPPATRLSNRHAPYPLTAPPQPLTPATTAYKGGRTQRPNRTPEEIQASEAAQALKRQAKSDKAAAKLVKTRMKTAQKLAHNVMKAKERAEATSRLKWGLEALQVCSGCQRRA